MSQDRIAELEQALRDARFHLVELTRDRNHYRQLYYNLRQEVDTERVARKQAKKCPILMPS
jgi:hypothetical protein